MIFGKKFPKILAISLFGFFILHFVGVYFYLYWKILWIDSPMHFAGGFLTAMVMIWWSYYTKKVSLPGALPAIYSFVVIVSAAALIGVLWEFYEFGVDKFVTGKNYINLTQPGLLDTLKDLFLDVIGGSLAAALFLHGRKKENQQY